MSKIICCPNCGQKNRTDGNPDGSKAVCAKCWTMLNVPKKTVNAPPPPNKAHTPPKTGKNNTESNKSSFGWVLLLVTGGLIWLVVTEQFSNDSVTSKTSGKSYSNSRSSPSYPEVIVPNNGEMQIFTNKEHIAPLTIRTSQGANYLVKLVSAYSQETAIIIFIRGGNTVSTKVPLGIYEVKYASGENWYGYKHLFGPETIYSKAEETFTFENSEYQISGFTITLYRVSNGNLRTSRIDQSQF